MRLFREGDRVEVTEPGSIYSGYVGIVDNITVNAHFPGTPDYASCRPEELAHLDPEPAGAKRKLLEDVGNELTRAEKHGGFNSAHEGFAVLLEEVDELKEHVWMRQSKRDLEAMRKEAVQVVAMAIKFVQMIDEGRGR